MSSHYKEVKENVLIYQNLDGILKLKDRHQKNNHHER